MKVLPACTFVIPCLNEAASLALCLRTIDSVRPRFAELEVILVDNGSRDDSIAIASAFGVRTLICATRGYGATVRTGIEAACFELVVFADADATYDWREAPLLVEELLKARASLVVGNRIRGWIAPGAMPRLNRWFGTPMLSVLITLLFGWARGTRIGDCNGGIRALRKTDFLRWRVRSNGMEFASEMIIRALKAGATYHEVPVSYRRSQALRKPHLRPWRDGVRHLRLILSARLPRTLR